MGPLPLFLIVAATYALVLVGLWRLAVRARRRGIAGPAMNVMDEVFHPIALDAQQEIQVQEERLAPRPSPGDRPDDGYRLDQPRELVAHPTRRSARSRPPPPPTGTAPGGNNRERPGLAPDMSAQMRTPGPDHPITIEPNPARVTVRVGDRVVADTTAALRLRESTYPPVAYVPMADVDQSLLRATDTTTHCPYKGDAAYYSLTLPEGELTDVIWTYPTPYPAVARIAGHVAFYADKVEISETA